MFGNNKKTEEAPKSLPSGTPAPGSALNAIVKGTLVEGTVKCENDLRIDGIIKGKLICSGRVIIGAQGKIEGEVRCKDAFIEGHFQGILHVSDQLNVRETALVDGEIFTNKLVVQSGARFNAACKMGVDSNNKGAETKTNVATYAGAAVPGAAGKAEARN